MKRLTILMTVLSFLTGLPLHATIINIPGDYPTIQQGINASTDGDTVLVQPGTYVENLNFNGHNIVLGSMFLTTGDTAYIAETVIDGDSAGTVVILNSSGQLIGFTIQHGVGTYGKGGGVTCSGEDVNIGVRFNRIRENYGVDLNAAGGIFVDQRITVTIANNFILRNSSLAGSSGGISVDESSQATILQNEITENSAALNGGAICLHRAHGVIENNLIANNSATRGGALYIVNCPLEIRNNSISNNSSQLSGAAVFVVGISSLLIESNSITDNMAGQGGGGIICASYSSPDIINNVISLNSSAYGGAGIFCYRANPLIENNTISGNVAGSTGGGVLVDEQSNPEIIGNDINGNSGLMGGGIYCRSDIQIYKNDIYNNSAPFGGGIYCFGSNPTIIQNNIFANSAIMRGAGIYCYEYSYPLISGNLIFENEGNGICCWYSIPLIKNNVVANNSSNIAGGLYSIDSRPILINSIFWYNTTQGGSGIYAEGEMNPQISYSNIQGGWEGEGNINIDPLFRDAANGDFHLMSTACGDPYNSPSIDTGSPAIADSLLDCAWGQGTNLSDMGAYGGGRHVGSIIDIPDDYATIQAGVNASLDGDTVLVQPGLYFENVNFQGRDIALGSLFLTTGDTSYIHSTIIDGDHIGPTIRCDNIDGNTAEIAGFTIQNGNADGGGGIRCYFASPRIRNNIIKNNLASYGGAVWQWNSNSMIINNIIAGNSANVSTIHCRLNSNSVFVNNIVTENAAVFCGGVYCSDNSNPIFTNTIIWGDSANTDLEVYIDSTSFPILTYSNIQGGWEGEGNIDVDPLFRDPENGDFHLMSTACGDQFDSPCIDAGDPAIEDILLDCSWGLGTLRSDMGAYGGGDSSMVGIEDHDVKPPERIALLQNFPNPFNPATTIRYALPDQSDVRIEIYNILGQKVATLFDGVRTASYHAVTWQADDYSSGVYFARLLAGRHSENIKMVLVK